MSPLAQRSSYTSAGGWFVSLAEASIVAAAAAVAAAEAKLACALAPSLIRYPLSDELSFRQASL